MALFHGGRSGYHSIFQFFGVRRTESLVPPIAGIGGSGYYKNATIETLHQQDQHTADGVELHPLRTMLPFVGLSLVFPRICEFDVRCSSDGTSVYLCD